MAFEEAWNAAAFNAWHEALQYVTFVGALALGAVVGLASRAPHYRIRWGLVIAASGALLILTAVITVRSIETKWQLRSDAAATDRELQAVADHDGANRASAPIIGAFYGAVAASICVGSAMTAAWLYRYLRLQAISTHA